MTPEQLIRKLTGRNIVLKYDKELAHRGVISYEKDFTITLNPLRCTATRQGRRFPNKGVLLAVTAHECGHYINWDPKRTQYKDELLAQLTALEMCHFHNYENIVSWLIVDLFNWHRKGNSLITPMFNKYIYIYEYWVKNTEYFPIEHIKQLKVELL